MRERKYYFLATPLQPLKFPSEIVSLNGLFHFGTKMGHVAKQRPIRHKLLDRKQLPEVANHTSCDMNSSATGLFSYSRNPKDTIQ